MAGTKGHSGGPRIPGPNKKLGRPPGRVKRLSIWLHYPRDVREQGALEWLQSLRPEDRLRMIAELLGVRL